MIYIRNPAMEFLEIDEEHLAIYDSSSGDVHYIEGPSKVILDLLKETVTSEDLVERLIELYDGAKMEIERDVCAFLSELVEKKVVIFS